MGATTTPEKLFISKYSSWSGSLNVQEIVITLNLQSPDNKIIIYLITRYERGNESKGSCNTGINFLRCKLKQPDSHHDIYSSFNESKWPVVRFLELCTVFLILRWCAASKKTNPETRRGADTGKIHKLSGNAPYPSRHSLASSPTSWSTQKASQALQAGPMERRFM